VQLRTSDDLGALVRDRRRVLGWNQQDLADRSGVSRRWVVALEQGKPSVETGMVLTVLAALGVNLDAQASPDSAGSELDHYLDELSDGH
jgi:HTH-type transcriptional regulator / antitoxin HipB